MEGSATETNNIPSTGQLINGNLSADTNTSGGPIVTGKIYPVAFSTIVAPAPNIKLPVQPEETVIIYSPAGYIIRRLDAGAGNSVIRDFRDEHGTRLTSGVYIVPTRKSVRRLLVIK